jgi:hypothetical protein
MNHEPDESDRDESHSGTSPETLAEMTEVAVRRASAIGKPVLVTGFPDSGEMRVYDVDPDSVEPEAPRERQRPREGMSADERRAFRESADGRRLNDALRRETGS